MFGERIYKVSVDAGFTCPNRDGTKGTSGCIYCNNLSFKPAYASPEIPVRQQLERGIEILSRRYKAERFFAYFQPYTNTYAPVDRLALLYEEALSHPKIAGLLIGTRSDSLPDPVWELLEQLSRRTFISLELGIESVYNETLQWINRGHDLSSVIATVERANRLNIFTTGHIILGFPTETRKQMLGYTTILNELNLNSLKIHHLHIVRDTPLERIYAEQPFKLWGVREYINFISRFLEQLRPDYIIQRLVGDASGESLVAPRWRTGKQEILSRIRLQLEQRGTYQGYRYLTDEKERQDTKDITR